MKGGNGEGGREKGNRVRERESELMLLVYQCKYTATSFDDNTLNTDDSII